MQSNTRLISLTAALVLFAAPDGRALNSLHFGAARLAPVHLGAGLWAPGFTSQGRPGSIYAAERGPLGLISDKTARRVGDLVTVLISETNDVSNEEQADLAKSTNLNYELTTLNLAPNLFNTLPDLGANSSDQFSGQAQVQKRDTFEAKLTAMVVDVLPNGNMVLSGRREIRVEDQTKLIEFSGVVRKYDVAPTNTVASELVANARIAYIGNGPTTRTTERTGGGSFIHRALDWLWPF